MCYLDSQGGIQLISTSIQSCAISIGTLARKDSVLVKLFIFLMRKDRIISLS